MSNCVKKIKITSLAKYLKELKKLKALAEKSSERSPTKTEFYFRGQSNSEYNLLPGIYRNGLLENEGNLFNDFLIKDPELFNVYNGDNTNFDKLSLMQHHGLPTRLLDITRNPLFALYFAASEGTNGKDTTLHSGTVFPFFNHINKESLKKKPDISSILEKKHGLEGFTTYKTVNSSFSDQIELEASMARMPSQDKKEIFEATQKFIKHSYFTRSIWKKCFNNKPAVKRLYHEVRRDIHDFSEDIRPLSFILPKIVTPRMIDKRIKNQQGLFIFVPFINPTNNLEKETQDLINLLRPTDESQMIEFCIPADKKVSILKELADCGISEDYVYPDHAHIAHSIKQKYIEKEKPCC